VSKVAKSSERYKEKVARLQNIYESLSPHGDLVPYEGIYRDLNRIRLELESIEQSSDDPGYDIAGVGSEDARLSTSQSILG